MTAAQTCAGSLANQHVVSVASAGAELVPSLSRLAHEWDVLACYHPLWLSILPSAGIDCSALVALEAGKPIGWILYSVFHGPRGTVVNSLPLVAYGGPVAKDDRADVQAALLAALREESEHLQADALTVCTPPFASTQRPKSWASAVGATHSLENFYQWQSLETHPAEKMSKRSRATMNRKLAAAEGKGWTVHPELPLQMLDTWIDLYCARYRKIGAVPFPGSFFRELHRVGVPAGLAQFWSVRKGDVLVGATVFLSSAKAIDYFASAFGPEFMVDSPNTLLLHRAFDCFREQGASRFNWQSSPGRGGVYEFKSRWGAAESHHVYLSCLLDAGSELLSNPVSEIKAAYPYRFVLPYSAWDQGQAA